MKVKVGAIVVALSMVCINSAFASSDDLEQRAKEKFEANRSTEVIVSYNKTNTKKTYENNLIPVRFIFERTANQITWNSKTKTAAVVRNGRQLVFSSKDITGSKNLIMWPKKWFTFKDGRTYVDMVYLNQIFDRYGDYEPNSEESAWAQKLSFLGISYIDSIYGGKDSIEHVFIDFN
ncbi:stalk domain-containing protein [Paenibacillus sp. GCM10023250]|uniref:stalk domain-containing protein n=1 Tax=Paenibacillus sp. GCM10023250 TaxID=3252648 RepID=UPI0036101B4D